MSTTITDIADRLKVSNGLVSRVLNNRDGVRVSEETRRRIHQAAQEMSYRPNRLARSLREGRTNTVALMISELDNPMFLSIARTLESALHDRGYQMILDASLTEAWTYREHAGQPSWPVDGILMYGQPANLTDCLGTLAQTVPIVFLDNQRDTQNQAVTFDFYAGGRLAAEHLVRKGYRRIAYVTHESYLRDFHHDGRFRAYEDVCREKSLTPQYIIVENIFPRCLAALKTGQRLASMEMPARPEAVLCLGDESAMYLCQGLRRAGLRVPGDIAVVGFDGIIEGQCLEIPLTTVQTPVVQLAEAAAEMLLARIKNPSNTGPLLVTLAPRLLIGETA